MLTSYLYTSSRLCWFEATVALSSRTIYNLSKHITAGMNNTVECKYEGGENLEQTVTSENSFDCMDSYCAHCCNSMEYSVKSLRNIFLSPNKQEGPTMAEVKPTSAKIERLPECKCREHTEEHRTTEKKPSNERLKETRSVQELRHLFETKLKSFEQASTKGSSGTYSRPVSSSKTAERQDTISLDPPHPEGQIFKYCEPPVHSKPCTRWNVTNTSVVEIANGMQITFTVMNDSKH